MKVKVIRHGTYPNEIADKEDHFAIGTVHEVIGEDPKGVYLPDIHGNEYLLMWDEVEEVDDSITLGGTGC